MKGQVYWVTVHVTSVTTHFKYQFELHEKIPISTIPTI